MIIIIVFWVMVINFFLIFVSTVSVKLIEKKIFLDNLIIDINEKDRESSVLKASISTCSTPRRDENINEEKLKILRTIEEHLTNVDYFEEIKAIKKIIAPIGPTLNAIKNQKHLDMPLMPLAKKTSVNKNIEPQRRLFSTKKKQKR